MRNVEELEYTCFIGRDILHNSFVSLDRDIDPELIDCERVKLVVTYQTQRISGISGEAEVFRVKGIGAPEVSFTTTPSAGHFC